MQDSRSVAAIHAALRYVIASEIPGEHKAVLLEALTDALRSREAAQHAKNVAEQTPSPWQSEEVHRLENFLEGKTAKSWQHADELLMSLVTQLHRSASDVRATAIERGFGVAVDYRLAKAGMRPSQA